MSFKNHRNRPNRIIDINGKLFKLNEVIDKTATDIHHLIGQKYRHQYNVNVEENKVRIPRRKHVALNSYFGGKQSPREQLIEVFNLVKQVLTPWVRQELYTILELTPDDMFYIQQVLKWSKQKAKKEKKIWSEQNSNNLQEKLFR